MSNVDQIVANAIKRSVSHNEIVTLGTASSPVDDAEAIMAALFVECDDCVNDDPKSVRAEYWGKDDGDNEWRVHVWFR